MRKIGRNGDGRAAVERERERRALLRDLCKRFGVLTRGQQSHVYELLHYLQANKIPRTAKKFRHDCLIGEMAGRLKLPVLQHVVTLVRDVAWTDEIISKFVTQPASNLLRQRDYVLRQTQNISGPALISQVVIRVNEALIDEQIRKEHCGQSGGENGQIGAGMKQPGGQGGGMNIQGAAIPKIVGA